MGVALMALGALLLIPQASATTPGTLSRSAPAAAPAVHVPEVSAMYRRWVEQAVAEEWGVDGSPARLAAQVHQESRWDASARSPVGAEGLTQFMPSTARWIAQKFPDKLGQFDPADPQQALLAAAVYDAWLVKRNPGVTACDSWAFGLSAYNGGEKYLGIEQAKARAAHRDPDMWFGNVAAMRARSLPAWRQNRDYVQRILLELEPAYIAAGWSGKVVCS
ncbi:transglycosylase SLT domain-containing protein [Dyella lutea]|uniref:Transglycosylase SLT domain-containing protein n=1 Tax=Dyella lutea TaxID=2950441 RepID=A0ABT1FDB1_9GAMM|nr:transglycosylase SLT domain-containing protein [Dyella lutea]MCP1375372.1 transglycosylase SLT domain-containing protein [Dyella lutea]